MLSTPLIRDWARRLIASEADADANWPSPQTWLATLRVYEKLRRQLCAPVGIDSFHALASRALSIAKSQSPSLSDVRVTANGGLSGIGEAEFHLGLDTDGEVGILLIAQLLGLCVTLLGEATTVRLIEGPAVEIEGKTELNRSVTSASAIDTSYFGTFEDILLEADQLRNVSERLETLADKHAGVEGLVSVAGNIRNIATVLDVFTLIRSKAGDSQDDAFSPPTDGYVN